MKYVIFVEEVSHWHNYCCCIKVCILISSFLSNRLEQAQVVLELATKLDDWLCNAEQELVQQPGFTSEASMVKSRLTQLQVSSTANCYNSFFYFPQHFSLLLFSFPFLVFCLSFPLISVLASLFKLLVITKISRF